MSDRLSQNTLIAKNSVFLSIRMIFVLCISLYSTRLILRILGVDDYGIYNVVAGFVSMMGFLNTSMSNGIQRFYNYEYGKNGEEGANRVFCQSLIIQLILSALVIIVSEIFGLWYLHNKMVISCERMIAAEWIFQFSVISIVLTIMQAPFTAAVMAHERLGFYALISILDSVLKLMAICLLPYLSWDNLILYGFCIALIALVNILSYYLFCKTNFREIEIKYISDKTLFFSIFSFSGWNFFGSFSNMMRNQGINLILNFFYGPVVNAARGVAMQINSGVTSFVSSISVPVRPQVIQSYACEDIERMMKLTYGISKFCLYVYFIMALPLCVEIDYVLSIWLGDVIPDHTQNFGVIVLVTTGILVPMSTLATLVHATGKMKNYQVIGSSVKILSVPFAFVLLKIGYAPEWAFVMVLLFDVLGFIVGLFIIRGLMPFSIRSYVVSVVIPIAPMILLGIAASVLIHYNIVFGLSRFVIVLTTCFFVSTISFYIIGMSKAEKILLEAMVKKMLTR